MISAVESQTDLPKVEDVWECLSFWGKLYILLEGKISIGKHKGPGHVGFSEFFIFMCFGCGRILVTHGQGYSCRPRCQPCDEKIK